MKALKSSQPDRYIVLQATQPPNTGRLTQPLVKIYFVFDTERGEWADSEGSPRWYNENDNGVAYERASHLNALDRQQKAATPIRSGIMLQPSETAPGLFCCCETAIIRALKGWQVHHSFNCPTKQMNITESQV
jgi:hypothetical protein